MQKTIVYNKANKVLIKGKDGDWTITVTSSGKVYKAMTAKDVEELKCVAFEMMPNNDVGRVMSEKVHNWYYSRPQ